MFDTAVSVKYNQGHWKWYEWIKLNEYYHQAKFDIYHIYGVWDNQNVKVFATYGRSAVRLAGQPDTDHYTDSRFSNKSKSALCMSPIIIYSSRHRLKLLSTTPNRHRQLITMPLWAGREINWPPLKLMRQDLLEQVPSGKMKICGHRPPDWLRCLISLMVFRRELGSSRLTNTGCVNWIIPVLRIKEAGVSP